MFSRGSNLKIHKLSYGDVVNDTSFVVERKHTRERDSRHAAALTSPRQSPTTRARRTRCIIQDNLRREPRTGRAGGSCFSQHETHVPKKVLSTYTSCVKERVPNGRQCDIHQVAGFK